MSFHRPTRLQLAYHEAGHAYAFAAAVPCEWPIEMVLGVDEDGRPRGWSKRRTLLAMGAAPVAAGASRAWSAAAEIHVAVAGPLAELRQRHRSRDAAAFVMLSNVDRFLVADAFDTDGDFEHIRSVMDRAGPIDRHATFRASIDAVDFSFALNWPSIRRLARTLHDRNRMGTRELSEWFADHPAAPCPVELRLVA